MRKKDNVKALREQRAEKVEELKLLYATIEGEQRAITDEENEQVKAIQAEIDSIDSTVEVLENIRARLAANGKKDDDTAEGEGEERAQAEEKAFADYLRGCVTGEMRADVNLTKSDNGVIIPNTIAKKIIQKAYDICPILEKATHYNVKGTLTIPAYPKDSNDISVAYATEFTTLTSSAGKFDTVTLNGFLAGALTKISISLMNNNDFDLTSFVVDHMAYQFSRWIEGELLKGTPSKITGLSTVEAGVTAAKAAEVTADELIDLQGQVKDVFKKNSMWIMSNNTRTAIRKLKDKEGRYLFQDDINNAFGGMLLGSPVHVSDNMPDMAANSMAIFYGDMSGLAVKISEEVQIQVLRELFATQHAVGVVGWLEMDSKVENAQKITAMKMAAS